jgi:hypothetical protein
MTRPSVTDMIIGASRLEGRSPGSGAAHGGHGVSRHRRRTDPSLQRSRTAGWHPAASQVVAAEREIAWTVGLLVVVAAAIVLGLPLLLDVAAAAFR